MKEKKNEENLNRCPYEKIRRVFYIHTSIIKVRRQKSFGCERKAMAIRECYIMHSPVLSQIEKTIDHLSREEQLWLIEQLAHRLLEDSIKSDAVEQATFESQLAAMATDPEIRIELQKINREFAVTEADGLESR
ncbi:MAG: hypothetical protein IMF19_08555 [Proteobacteria bacterium]|nr:hypothetical protein [Pseudomonadota bacterium]